jgi:hypothetical protein
MSEHDLTHGVIIGQHGDDEFADAHVGDTCRWAQSECHERPQLLGPTNVSDHLAASSRQVCCHGFAHAAEPDDSDPAFNRTFDAFSSRRLPLGNRRSLCGGGEGRRCIALVLEHLALLGSGTPRLQASEHHETYARSKCSSPLAPICPSLRRLRSGGVQRVPRPALRKRSGRLKIACVLSNDPDNTHLNDFKMRSLVRAIESGGPATCRRDHAARGRIVLFG